MRTWTVICWGQGFFVDGLGLHGLPGHPLGSSRKQVQSIWG